ncbi:MAG: polysulfide reductase [Deltaproteobacteria bacterium CG_4_9_14_3_um_filter_63_12]|nr:MAG: polysulfide reductase [Deltaproteobacteria bacterium CG17_big_fil_post_rev_8_21_14_2_50_63_7]PJB41971.1 MAG: polysulfide reductase [Deltaproteobacteria bacterium CG_4_9_14_3_um_filter_63_12]
MRFLRFVLESIHVATHGSKAYFAWVGFLLLLMALGAYGYWSQIQNGLSQTNMRDPVSWGFYIGNFTFLVGVAAASVMLVIPAYVYNWKPIKEIAILGELLAVAAIIMCIGFVVVDVGRPDRLWHTLPSPFGELNFPRSLLSWDILVLNSYLFLNLFIVTYLLYYSYIKKPYNKSFVYPLLWLSIPVAVSIHTVTAFLYAGVAARPFWNASILAPRFLASAFCSGPAILLILFQVLRKTTKFHITDEAIQKIAELMAYAMALNLFLLAAEVFREFYSDTEHVMYSKYLFFGLGEHRALVVYAWSSVVFSAIAFLLFLISKTRKNFVTLNIGCVLIYIGVYIEKGLALIIPGLTPGTLGEVYEYVPSATEIMVSAGVFSLGFLLFTIMVKIASSFMNYDLAHAAEPEAVEDDSDAEEAVEAAGAVKA